MIRALVVVALAACQLPYTGGARAVAPTTELDAHWLRAAPTPVVRQHHDSDCGLAALAMVAGAWGRTWSVDALETAMPPNQRGVKLGALRDYARTHGLDAYAVAATPDDLAHELRAGRPVVIGLMLPFDDHRNRSHYEVAIAMDPDTGSLITIDPASGVRMRRSRSVLDVEWKAASYATLVVTGTRDASLTNGDLP